jgi:hypothetical protein
MSDPKGTHEENAVSDPKGTHEQKKAMSDPKGTHEQKAVSDPKGTHEQKKAMSDPKGTHEQKAENATSDTEQLKAMSGKSTEPEKAKKRKKAKDNGVPSEPERRSMRIQGRAAKALMVDEAESPPNGNDPRTYRQAMACNLQKQWKEAMRQEYASLIKNNTFTPVSEANSQPIG